MTVRSLPAWLIPVLLFYAAATAADENESAASQQPTSTLAQVQLQGQSSAARERKTLAQIYQAQALFQKHRQLAPDAALTYRVYARQRADDLERADLGLVGAHGRLPVQLDARQSFVPDPSWLALDPDSELRSKLAEGRITWRPDIRTPGWPADERRLGDLRLQCRIAFASGLARTDPVWVNMLQGLFRPFYDQCEVADWSPSNFADRPIFSVTLVHGERRLKLNQRYLHGLTDDQGAICDWGFRLRDRMFRVPLGDASWPDETRVLLESLDGPGPAPSPELQASEHRFAEAARALRPDLSSADDIRAALGKAEPTVVRFDSGMQIWSYWQAAGKAAERGTELVLLLNAEGALQKLAFSEVR